MPQVDDHRSEQPDQFAILLPPPSMALPSPQMSLGTFQQASPTMMFRTGRQPQTGPDQRNIQSQNVYMAAAHAAQKPRQDFSPQHLQRMFESVVSPPMPTTVSPMDGCFMNGGLASPSFLPSPPPFYTLNGSEHPYFSPLQRSLHFSPTQVYHGTGHRVAKIPMKPQFAAPSSKKQPPKVLPCQLVNPHTNLLAAQPGFADILSPDASPVFSTILPGGITIDSGPWLADFIEHRAAFLSDFAKIDFENITVIEMKSLLRKYGLSRTGKKVELEDRIRQVAKFLERQMEKEKEAGRGKSKNLCDLNEFLKSP